MTDNSKSTIARCVRAAKPHDKRQDIRDDAVSGLRRNSGKSYVEPASVKSLKIKGLFVEINITMNSTSSGVQYWGWAAAALFGDRTQRR